MFYSVEEFLTFLKLEEYLPNFINNNITDLHLIDESLLVSIGIDKVGHRKRILSELVKLLGTLPQDSYSILNNIEDDEVAPPLPPKQRNREAVSLCSQSNEISPETLPVAKPRPVKPPRITAPGTVKLNSLANQNPVASASVSEPQIPSDTNTTTSPVQRESPSLHVRTNESNIKSNPPLMVFPPPPSESDMQESPLLIFPPPPSHPPPLTPSFQSQPISQPTVPMRTFSQKRTKNRSCIEPITRPAVQPRIQLLEQPTNITMQSVEKPDIPPRDYPGDRLVHATSISKDERMTKSQSVDLMSFNENVHGPTDDIPVDDKRLPRSSNLEKRHTISSSDRIIHAAKLQAELNNTRYENRSCNLQNDSGNLTMNSGVRSRMDNDSSSNVCVQQEDIVSSSDDDIDQYTQDTGEVDKTSISMSLSRNKGVCGNIDDSRSKSNSAHRKSRYFQPMTKNWSMLLGKRTTNRYVEFTGTEINCFKARNDLLKLIIPVKKIDDVRIEQDTKKVAFYINTKNGRKYTFIEPNGDHNELTIWANVICEALMACIGDEVDDNSCGLMENPDMEGYLKKEGHNVVHDKKKRYVVIKGQKLCYYNNKEDFDADMDFISCFNMALVSLKTEEERLQLILNTHLRRNYVFQADDTSSFINWKEAIEMCIQYAHGDDTIRNQIQENESNKKCADCGENNAIYASINLLVVACPKCIGFHREMGVHISKTRSLLMDERVWTTSSVKLLQTVGNDKANSLWAYNLPYDDMIKPNSSGEDRELFIKSKYKDKKYFNWSTFFGQTEELGKSLREVVVTDNVLETLKLLISGADVYYVPEGSADQRTPYELAKESGMELQVELLYQYNGHLTKEERKEIEHQKSAMQQAKTGLLQIKTTRSDTLRERMCTILDKKIEVRKVDKNDECEIIDLTKLEELEIDKEDMTTLVLKLSDRTYYYLKSVLPEEAESWYYAIHSKQVFGVPIQVQECNRKKIPYLIGECISFLEQHAMMIEGIYRRNGSQLVIKRLTMLFNQDAANIKLQIDEFHDVHAVAGLIKLYLRQLPDALLTKKLYDCLISNSEATTDEDEHNRKLYQYKKILEELPLINYTTLRFLILHLNQVINLSEVNEMGLNNIIVIFGPIVLSRGNTIDQRMLKKEYTVLSDMLTYYEWLFEVTEVEIKVQKGMIEFLRNTQEPQQQNTSDFTMVTIFVGDNEDQMKMTSSTKPSEVCLFCLKKHNLSVNTNWGLFEVTVDGDLERLVHASESVLRLAEAMGVKRKLVVKCNNVTEILSMHRSANLEISGKLHFSKGDKWRKNYYVEVKKGNIRVFKAEGNTKEEENIPIHGIQLFIGNPVKKKPLTRFGFAIYKSKEEEFRYFCAEDEDALNKFIAIILLVKYPNGVWTPISDKTDEPVISGDSDDSSFWGRQSTIIRPSGTSNRLRDQIGRKRQTLKNIFMK